MKMTTELPITRCENVEVVLAAVPVQQTKFAAQDNLAGKKIRSIDCVAIADQTVSPSGNTICNATAFKKAYVTFVSNGIESINKLPLSALVPSLNNGRRILLDDIEIDFQKSFIHLGSTVGAVGAEAFLFNFYFDDKPCEK